MIKTNLNFDAVQIQSYSEMIRITNVDGSNNNDKEKKLNTLFYIDSLTAN